MRSPPKIHRTKGLAKKVKAIIMDVSETKHKDTTITVEVNSAKSITHLTPIAQGTTETTRIGDKLHPIGLTVHMCLGNSNAGINGASCSRIMIARSRLGRALTVSDFPVLQGITDYNKIFVLYDKYITVTGPDGAGPQSIARKIFIKKKRFLRCEYAPGSTTTVLNGVYLYTVGDFAAANGNAPDLEAQCHLSFKDI